MVAVVGRRTVLGSLGASAAMLALPGLAKHGEPALKRLVRSPTVDVHAHLVAGAWFGQKPEAPKSYTREALALEISRNPYIPVPDAAAIVDANWARLLAYEAARADGRIETSADYLIAQMDAAGIDIVVNLCMDEVGRPFKRTYAVPIDTVLDDISRAAKRHPGRIVNFFGVDPRRGAEGVTLLDRAVREYGVCGMGEWLTHRWNVFPNDRAVAYPYLEKCAELNIPYLNNGSGVEPTQDPAVFAQVLTDFPSLRVVNGAAGLLTDAERQGRPDQIDLPYRLLDLAEKHDNFWLDLDDWERLDAPGKERTFAFLKRAFAGDARERIMFGSDFPVFDRQISIARWTSTLIDDSAKAGYRFSQSDYRRFFSSNTLHLLDGPQAPAFIQQAAARL